MRVEVVAVVTDGTAKFDTGDRALCRDCPKSALADVEVGGRLRRREQALFKTGVVRGVFQGVLVIVALVRRHFAVRMSRIMDM